MTCIVAAFLLLANFVFLCSVADDTSQKLQLSMFDRDSEPDAVCNDGTMGGYYFSSASDPSQSSVFVVYLPGNNLFFRYLHLTSLPIGCRWWSVL